MSITTSPSMPNLSHETTVIIMYSLGISFCVALVLLVLLAVIRCKNHQKARRQSETLHQANDRSNDEQIHMHHVGNSSQNQSAADNVDSLKAISTKDGGVGHSFRYNQDNRFRDATSHQEDPYHIYQDAAEVEKVRSQTAEVEQISSCSLAILSSVKSPVSTSLTSIPSCSDNYGLQETSLNQSMGCSEDDEYQDVDIWRKNRMTNVAALLRSPSGARLFDDSCYNSLDFGIRSEGVCARRLKARPCNTHICEAEVVDESEFNRTMVNEYAELSDSKEHAQIIHGDQEYNHINQYQPASGSTTKRKVCSDRENTTSCDTSKGFLPAEPPEDILYNQLEPEERYKVDTSNELQYSDAFDSEYNKLKPQKDANDISLPIMRETDFSAHHGTDNSVCFISKPKTCEELYAKVDKTVGASFTPPAPPCEELYAKVDKKRGVPSAAPPSCEELYAKVDKTKRPVSNDSKPAWQEELYMNVRLRSQPPKSACLGDRPASFWPISAGQRPISDR
ncbi:uncharacterized protein [Diadema antillarum]|uniref:uncharacterized protein n=1 Tax=Diadema antillarum TaxID=105358 RepID=UPI003A844ADB